MLNDPMTTAVTVKPAQKTPLTQRFQGSLQQLLAFASLLIIVVAFSILLPESFPTLNNLSSILTAVAYVGILALGVTFVIITAGIDLSLGTGMILCGVMAGVFITNFGLPVWIGIILTLGVGALIGFVNGFSIAVLKLPPFIATLGMMMITTGLALVISNKKPIYFNGAPEFGAIMNKSLIDPQIMRLPAGIVAFIVICVLAHFLLKNTLLGRNAFAIGSNEKATALSGVNVNKWLIWIYVVCGISMAIAGVISASRLSSAQPTGGAGIELQAIAAVIIGGTSLAGGRGTILGTVIGAFIMAVLDNGLRMAGVPQEWQQVAIGVVIIVAVYLDIIRKKA